MDQFSNIFRHCLHVGGLWGIWARLSTLLHYISFEIWIVKYSTYMEIYMEIGYWLLFIHLWGGYWSEMDFLLSSSWTGLDCQEQVLKYKYKSSGKFLNMQLQAMIGDLTKVKSIQSQNSFTRLRLTKGNCDKKPFPMDVSNWFWSHLIESHPIPIPIGYELFYFFQKIKTWTD